MPRSSSLVPAAFALAGTLIGFGIATASRGDAAVPAADLALQPAKEGSGTDAAIAQLSEEIHWLGQHIASLAGARAGATTGATNAREPLVPDSESGATHIVALLERCTTLIERLERGAAGGRPADLVVDNPAASRASLEELDFEAEDFAARVSKQHLLWGCQRVLDAYGAPDMIWSDEKGVVWAYRIEREAGDSVLMQFRCVDHYVKEVVAH